MNRVQGFGGVRMQGSKDSGGQGFKGAKSRKEEKHLLKYGIQLPLNPRNLVPCPLPTTPWTLGPIILWTIRN